MDGKSDLISRKAVCNWLNNMEKYGRKEDAHGYHNACAYVSQMPSALSESLSSEYIKAVWTWLLDYQIRVAELRGKYKPYEVLSWVANDWRKEHERFD